MVLLILLFLCIFIIITMYKIRKQLRINRLKIDLYVKKIEKYNKVEREDATKIREMTLTMLEDIIKKDVAKH